PGAAASARGATSRASRASARSGRRAPPPARARRPPRPATLPSFVPRGATIVRGRLRRMRGLSRRASPAIKAGGQACAQRGLAGGEPSVHGLAPPPRAAPPHETVKTVL